MRVVPCTAARRGVVCTAAPCAAHSHSFTRARPLTDTMEGPLAIDIFHVEHGAGLAMPRITLQNRRAGGAVPRMLHWVCQRHLEILLFRRTDGGSSGAIWKLLSASGLGSTSLCCSRKAVSDGVITEDEFKQIMSSFKQALPPELCDPSSLGRIRFCTLLPVATAALVCRQHGRSPASIAWLRSFSQPVPESWELHEQAERDRTNGQLDLALEEQLDDASFEVEEVSFHEELTSMPAFQSVPDDEERMRTYTLQRVPQALRSELEAYISYRTATFAARRQGGAVQSISAEADKLQLLRFFGYLQRTDRLPSDQLLDITLMIRPDLGDMAAEYALWLQNTQRCRFSTIANYLNGLISITQWCYSDLDASDQVLLMEPSPLAQLINLRGQAEKASKTQQLYDKRVGGWCEWPDVQRARVSALKVLTGPSAAAQGTPARRNHLRDAAALSLLSLIPPDRVGCIRKLRLGHTLKKKANGVSLRIMPRGTRGQTRIPTVHPPNGCHHHPDCGLCEHVHETSLVCTHAALVRICL
jgi:hypothetical protein